MLSFDDYGRGPAVLLLHGIPSTTTYFDSLIEMLVARRRVLVPEMPGYGQSRRLEGAYDYDAVNQMIEDGLLEKGIKEVAVLGFSGGAYRAIGLALRGRVKVTRLVLHSGFAGWDAEDRQAMRDTIALARSGFDFHPVWLQRMMGPGAPQKFPREAAEVMRWLDCVPLDVPIAELEALCNAPDLRPRLSELQIPVLVRCGTEDGGAPARWSEAIVAHKPDAQLQLVPGCGHALLYEDRPASIRAFVAGLGAPLPGSY